MWNRRALTPTDLLIALPYLLLPAGMALTLFVQSFSTDPYDYTGWWVARWAVRLLFVAGAYAGWRLGRPRWFYVWLGFAVYEAVATLLIPLDILEGTGLAWLVLPAFLFAFFPYFAAILWLGPGQSRLASYSVLPHAALTYPLFFFALPDFFREQEWFLVGASAASGVLLAGIAIQFWQPAPPGVRLSDRAWRWLLLYTGVGVAVLAQMFVIVSQQREWMALFLALPLTFLGWLILSVPPVLAVVRRIFSREIGPALGKRLPGLSRLNSALPTFSVGQRDEFARLSAQFSISSGGSPMSEIAAEQSTPPVAPKEPVGPRQPVGPGLERAYKSSVVILTALVALTVLLYVGRAAVYKIHEFERGLHLRGGRFVGVQLPGWHMQIPLVDTVIVVKINERLGYVERIPAMTSDNVTMNVSLQYTYRVTEPERFSLAVDDPERIVFEFVQGKLRDVINTKAMADVMNQRAAMNQEVMAALKDKEEQYGVQFITVQMQSASPPDEVLTAIKDRMVAVQRQEQAQAEAAQRRTLADADFYTAQKEADADAYQITTTAAAEAERIRLTTEAQQLSLRAMLAELAGTGTIGEKYIELMIAEALRENSKWIIGGNGSSILDIGGIGE